MKVLDIDSSNQVDLGALKSVNKRQASKTEVFKNFASHKKNQVAVQQTVAVSHSKLSYAKATASNTLHKKATSHLPSTKQGFTRNNQLEKKHMTTTTSPVERISDWKGKQRGKQSLGQGKAVTEEDEFMPVSPRFEKQ